MTVVAAAKRGNTFFNSTKPSGVSLNGKGLRSVREVALQHFDAEYLYLRENELEQFDADINLENLKVLDLSINEISGTVDFLPRTPFLRHLYMTGNKIETLMGLGNFASLETLCLSDNSINSFEGLEGLPNLRVLSLNFNNISSFEFYQSLPSLHTLNLVGNPITEGAFYRSMAIAINGRELVSVDGNAVQEEERSAVKQYHGKVVYCISEGFVPEADNVEEAANAFLLKHQRTAQKSKCLQLCSIGLSSNNGTNGELSEGHPIALNVCLQDIRPLEQRTSEVFQSNYLYPVIFKVSGEAFEAFVVGSMNNWTDPIELERCEEDGEIYFHTTLYLPAGDYEYRYIVDGREQVSDIDRITSKYNQNDCNLYRVSAEEPHEDISDTILHIRWLRSDAENNFEVIEGQNALSYTPTVAEVGSCLRVEVIAYVNGEYSFLYFDISTPIVPGVPYCPHLKISGDAAEGAVLIAEADYVGGAEGNSLLAWYRVDSNDEETPVELHDPWAGYRVTKEDIGCRIKVEFTPVRNDWVAGQPRSVITEPIVAGRPECLSIKIIGDLVEGAELEVEVLYTGGVEGTSCYQWLRKDGGSDEYIAIEGETENKYIASLEDVGKWLAVEYTPVNQEGEEGETCRCVLERPIEPALPEIRNLIIMGEMEEGHVLTLAYEYTGGHSSDHAIQWFRRDDYKKISKIGVPHKSTVHVTEEEVHSFIEVSVTPMRADGERGKAVHAKASSAVRPAAPKVSLLTILGEPREGSELEVQATYAGGTPSEPIIVWERENPETNEFEVVATETRKYFLSREDAGKMLKVTYTPIRSDGVEGEPVSRLVQVEGQGVEDPDDSEPADSA